MMNEVRLLLKNQLLALFGFNKSGIPAIPAKSAS